MRPVSVDGVFQRAQTSLLTNSYEWTNKQFNRVNFSGQKPKCDAKRDLPATSVGARSQELMDMRGDRGFMRFELWISNENKCASCSGSALRARFIPGKMMFVGAISLNLLF